MQQDHWRPTRVRDVNWVVWRVPEDESANAGVAGGLEGPTAVTKESVS